MQFDPGGVMLKPTTENIERAATLLGQGELVAFPTETVYGLGADAGNDRAIAAVYQAKGRPAFNPLIIHFASTEAAEQAVVFDDRARRLAKAFWPGALTMVLNRREGCPVSLLASAGLPTLAVRIPDHPVANALLRQAGCAIAAPSANSSGRISPTAAEHVLEDLGDRVAAILDGGPCGVGIESTVIDLSGERPALLRPGGIAGADIEALIGPLAAAGDGDQAPRSPGMQSRHYAPAIPIRINAESAMAGEALLAFGPGVKNRYVNLSRSGDLREAAANLFAMLHMLDRPGFNGIAVMPVPETGLGIAINDRLRRAAAEKN